MTESTENPSHETAKQLVDLLQAAFDLTAIEEAADTVLPRLAELVRSDVAILYVSDPRFPVSYFLCHGLELKETSTLEELCVEQFDQIIRKRSGLTVRTLASSSEESAAAVETYPLSIDKRCIGLVGIPSGKGRLSSEGIWERILNALAWAIDHLAEHASTERKLLHLNTYLTVSSMLAKSIDLSEVLEIALFCCMEAVSAEAASLLILDDTKENFQFYRVEGPAKPLLGGHTFPANRGLAGCVLQTLEVEIINDVENDPRFYGEIDQKTGFHTRNMIAVPLVAGEERVGVLEVLNKANEGSFTADERLLLVSIADEIAFGIRNATVFDYIVNTYCKRRQGQHSCKGCERPLGSWTPCMRYREFTP